MSEFQIEVYNQPAQARADYLQRRDYQIPENLSVELEGKVVGEVALSTVFPQIF